MPERLARGREQREREAGGEMAEVELPARVPGDVGGKRLDRGSEEPSGRNRRADEQAECGPLKA